MTHFDDYDLIDKHEINSLCKFRVSLCLILSLVFIVILLLGPFYSFMIVKRQQVLIHKVVECKSCHNINLQDTTYWCCPSISYEIIYTTHDYDICRVWRYEQLEESNKEKICANQRNNILNSLNESFQDYIHTIIIFSVCSLICMISAIIAIIVRNNQLKQLP